MNGFRETRLLVDGMNVVGSRPDGWWRDRERAMRTLVGELDRYARAGGERAVIVFDGPRSPRSPRSSPNVQVVFTADSRPDAADDVIAARVAADPDPSTLTVVTSDRRLADRVRAHGANVIGARSFRRRLDVSGRASRAD